MAIQLLTFIYFKVQFFIEKSFIFTSKEQKDHSFYDTIRRYAVSEIRLDDRCFRGFDFLLFEAFLLDEPLM